MAICLIPKKAIQEEKENLLNQGKQKKGEIQEKRQQQVDDARSYGFGEQVLPDSDDVAAAADAAAADDDDDDVHDDGDPQMVATQRESLIMHQVEEERCVVQHSA